jgi:hypothetical protein
MAASGGYRSQLSATQNDLRRLELQHQEEQRREQALVNENAAVMSQWLEQLNQTRRELARLLDAMKQGAQQSWTDEQRCAVQQRIDQLLAHVNTLEAHVASLQRYQLELIEYNGQRQRDRVAVCQELLRRCELQRQLIMVADGNANANAQAHNCDENVVVDDDGKESSVQQQQQHVRRHCETSGTQLHKALFELERENWLNVEQARERGEAEHLKRRVHTVFSLANQSSSDATAARKAAHSAKKRSAPLVFSHDFPNPKITNCPHVTRPHEAKGRCKPCYNRSKGWWVRKYRSPSNVAVRDAGGAADCQLADWLPKLLGAEQAEPLLPKFAAAGMATLISIFNITPAGLRDIVGITDELAIEKICSSLPSSILHRCGLCLDIGHNRRTCPKNKHANIYTLLPTSDDIAHQTDEEAERATAERKQLLATRSTRQTKAASSEANDNGKDDDQVVVVDDDDDEQNETASVKRSRQHDSDHLQEETKRVRTE